MRLDDFAYTELMMNHFELENVHKYIKDVSPDSKEYRDLLKIEIELLKYKQIICENNNL